VGPILLEDKLGELSEVFVKSESVDSGLSCLVPSNESRFEHSLCDEADNFGGLLFSMLHVALAREGPGLKDERCDSPSSEDGAIFHLGSANFGEGLTFGHFRVFGCEGR
jgi:hypothetical protein